MPFGDATPDAQAIRTRIGPFSHAIDWAVRLRRPEAPFAKLAVIVVQQAGDSTGATGFKHGSIAVCHVPANLRSLAELPGPGARRAAAALTAKALEWVQGAFAWRDDWFNALVDEAGSHSGPYRVEWDAMSVSDRQRALHVPIIEFDERGPRLLVSRRDAVRGETDERSIGLPTLSLYVLLESGRRARLMECTIVYLDRSGAPMARVELSVFDRLPSDIDAR